VSRAGYGVRSTLITILIPVLLALSLAGFPGCGGSPAETKVEPQPQAEDLQAAYLEAVQDAEVAQPDEISRDLTALVAWEEGLEWEGVPGKSRVKVLVWTGKDYYDSHVGQDYQLPADANVWVTPVPELEDCFTGEEALMEPSELRAKQLLGLPPDGNYTKFVELWVNPPDLFRPSPDPETNDREAELDFPTRSSRIVAFNNACTITEWDYGENRDITYTYEEWFVHRKQTIYYGDHPYPWTCLGYTYDWGNPESDVGLSEFVILGGSTVGVYSVTPTGVYLGI
jgi:hypothetical protein